MTKKTNSSPASASKPYFSILMNLAVAAFSATGTAIGFRNQSFSMFAYYTVDSNIFAMLACTLYAAFLIRKLISGKEPPVFAVMAKYMAVCCLTVTFLVVTAVLAPMNGLKGYQMMLFSNEFLYHHLLSPVLAALSFFIFDRVPLSPGKAARFALIPTAVYASAAILLNLAKVLTGPYPFLMVYRQPVYMSFLWGFLILGSAFALAYLLARISQKKPARL